MLSFDNVKKVKMKLEQILKTYSCLEIFKKTGVNRSYIWLIKTGKRKPKPCTIERIERYYK